MKLRLRYFGMVADRLGKSSEEVEWSGGPGPVDLREWICNLHPTLADMQWKVALEQEIVEGPCTLRADAEIVVLPPFAGG